MPYHCFCRELALLKQRKKMEIKDYMDKREIYRKAYEIIRQSEKVGVPLRLEDVLPSAIGCVYGRNPVSN
jgi:hypothetical protein